MIQREDINDSFLSEVIPLVMEHYDEVGTEGYKVSMDKALYTKLSTQHLYAAYTLRKWGRLVGYLSFWILYHPHYLMNVAQMDLFYIKRGYRGRNAFKLIRFSEKDLRKNYNIDVVFTSTSSKKDISPLFKRLGYKDSDKMFMKEL